jgi:hypothetical protein
VRFEDVVYTAAIEVAYKDWTALVGRQAEGFYVQWRFNAPCNSTGGDVVQKGRKWYVSPHATKSEVVQTLLKAALAAEEHEAREQFLYKGRAVYGPHPDVDVLWAAQLPEAVRAEVAA